MLVLWCRYFYPRTKLAEHSSQFIYLPVCLPKDNSIQRTKFVLSLFSWTAFTLSTPFCINFSCCMKNLLCNFWYVDYMKCCPHRKCWDYLPLSLLALPPSHSVSNTHVTLLFPYYRPSHIFQPWDTGTASLVVNACPQCHRHRKSLRLQTSCFKIRIYWPLWSCFYLTQSWCDILFLYCIYGNWCCCGNRKENQTQSGCHVTVIKLSFIYYLLWLFFWRKKLYIWFF